MEEMMEELSAKERTKIVDQVTSYVSAGVANCHTFHERMVTNQARYRGEQWSRQDLSRQKKRNRPAAVLNDTFKVVNAIANREMVERLVPKLMPRESSDGAIADVADAACRWQRQNAMSEHYESAAFKAAIIGAIGCCNKYWAPHANNGAGAILDRDVPLYEMVWDPRAREQNLMDRRWHARGRWVDIDDAAATYGTKSKRLRKKFNELKNRIRIGKTDNSDIGDGGKRGVLGTPGFGWNFVKGGQWFNGPQNEVFVTETEYREIDHVFRAVIPTRFQEWHAFVVGQQPLAVEQLDPQTGQPAMDPQTQQPLPPMEVQFQQYMVMPEEQREALRGQTLQAADTETLTREELDDFMAAWEEAVGAEFEDYDEVPREQIRYAVVVDGELADYGIRDWGWSYHFITCFGSESVDGVEWFSVVDLIAGPQDLKNAFVSAMLSNYIANPKGGWLLAASMGADAERIADQMSSPNAFVKVKDEVIANFDSKMKQLPQSQFPNLGKELYGIYNDSVMTTLGLDPLSIGAQTDLRRVSGVVAQSARIASNTVTAQPFDSLRLFRRQYAITNLKFIYRQYDLESLIRIVGVEKIQNIGVFDPDKWPEVLTYDIVIDEQPMTPTEMHAFFETLNTTGLLGTLWQGGALTNEDVIEILGAAGLPESMKRSILRNQGLAQQVQQLQQQIQMLTAAQGGAPGVPPPEGGVPEGGM